MAVRIILELQIEGDGEVEQSIREHLEWINKQGQTSSAFHELIGHLAIMRARIAWRDADMFRKFEEQRRIRIEKAKQRGTTR